MERLDVSHVAVDGEAVESLLRGLGREQSPATATWEPAMFDHEHLAGREILVRHVVTPVALSSSSR